MDAAIAADGVDRDDVRMLQASSGQGFVLEALQLLGIQRCSEGQDFQGHAAAQGDLLRFIDDAHAAAAHLAQQAKIAELTQRRVASG